jgi:hypothetical protein
LPCRGRSPRPRRNVTGAHPVGVGACYVLLNIVPALAPRSYRDHSPKCALDRGDAGYAGGGGGRHSRQIGGTDRRSGDATNVVRRMRCSILSRLGVEHRP